MKLKINRKKNYIIVVACVIILAGIGVGYELNKYNLPHIIYWKKYENKKWGYVVKYPNNWLISDIWGGVDDSVTIQTKCIEGISELCSFATITPRNDCDILSTGSVASCVIDRPENEKIIEEANISTSKEKIIKFKKFGNTSVPGYEYVENGYLLEKNKTMYILSYNESSTATDNITDRKNMDSLWKNLEIFKTIYESFDIYQTENIPDSNAEKKLISKWKIYTDSQKHFSFKYPHIMIPKKVNENENRIEFFIKDPNSGEKTTSRL